MTDNQLVLRDLNEQDEASFFAGMKAWEGEEIVGRLSMRLELNENLKKRGGHIGYSVAPKFRKRGYATEIIKQGLPYCASLGLKELLITCGDSNTPSCKLIENFGGELITKEWDDIAGEQIRKYNLKIAL